MMTLNIETNVSLKSYNTFGVDEVAEQFVSINTEEALQELFTDEQTKLMPKKILGRGSNILVTKPVKQLLVHINLKGKEIISETGKSVTVQAAAGENWHEFVLWTLEKNLGGLENLSLIPGNVGTSPIQNIGAYGVEMKDTFESLDAIEISTGQKRTFSKDQCQFDYRQSVFKSALKDKYIITQVRFTLAKNPILNTDYGAIKKELERRNIADPTIHDVSKVIIAIRQSKLPDPVEIGNGGSFFKNPVISILDFAKLENKYDQIPYYPTDDKKIKIPAAYLIDKAGWKGKKHGNAGVHKNQALVLVNHGDATGQEILDLAHLIQTDVKAKFGITLEPEVNIW